MKAVIVTYVVRSGKETEFVKILKKHLKVLKKEGLSTNQAPFLLRDPENPAVFKEIFEWKSKRSFQKAHESAQVQSVWSQMKRLTMAGGIEPAYFTRI